MPQLRVVQLPAPILTTPTEVVVDIDDNVRQFCRDLVETMYASPACVGLAANQVADPRRIFCADITGHAKADSVHGLVIMINPEIVVARAPVTMREGCMSVPDLTGNVTRASEVVIRGKTPAGATQVIEANAFEARCLLHEIDHLDGKTFLNRVRSFGADVFPRKRYR